MYPVSRKGFLPPLSMDTTEAGFEFKVVFILSLRVLEYQKIHRTARVHNWSQWGAVHEQICFLSQEEPPTPLL
jgi:hypothetical protein